MKKTAGLTIFAMAFLFGYFAVLPFIKALPVISPVVFENSSSIPSSILESEPVEAEYDPDSESKKTSKVKLLWASDFHSDFFPYKNGEKWFGLFKKGEDLVLEPTTIKVAKLRNPELFDISAGTEQKEQSVFLIRGLAFLRESKIPTVHENITDDDGNLGLTAKPQTFDFNGVSYSLFVENLTDAEFPGKGSKLILEAKGKRQVLRYLKNGCDDCAWALGWAGDLDLDGKLDFYMELSDHYNVTDQVLFLSSPAEKNKLVKFIASFSSVGC